MRRIRRPGDFHRCRSRLEVPGRALPSIEEVASPELGLAGVRIDPRTNGPPRSSFSLSGLLIREIDGSRLRLSSASPAEAPQAARGGNPG